DGLIHHRNSTCDAGTDLCRPASWPLRPGCRWRDHHAIDADHLVRNFPDRQTWPSHGDFRAGHLFRPSDRTHALRVDRRAFPVADPVYDDVAYRYDRHDYRLLYSR